MQYIITDLLTFSVIGSIIGWSLRILALLTVPRNRSPSSALAWLMVIFLMPIPGWIFFILFGGTKLPKDRRDLQVRVNHMIASFGDKYGVNPEMIPKKYQSIAKLATALTHLKTIKVPDYQIISDYDESFKKIIQDIKTARKTIYMEYFIFVADDSTEEIIRELEKASQRGVEVKLLYDSVSTFWGYLRRTPKLLRRLKRAGIRTEASLPIRLLFTHRMRPDLRNHRKIVTIDGRVAYIGSQNIIEKRYLRKDGMRYKEVMVRLTGPAALQLEAIFEADWYAETREQLDLTMPDVSPEDGVLAQIVPSGPGYEDENNLRVIVEMIYAAQKELIIVSPYFVPDESIMTAIISASKRGVNVKIINSEEIDQLLTAHAQRSYYEELLSAGVEIYWHKKPVFVHSKFMTIDGQVSFIGSSNMDIRSFELDHEISMLVYDDKFTDKLDEIAIGYIDQSTKIDKDKWLARPRYLQLIDSIARLTSSFQ